MRIAIGADSAGAELKNLLKSRLTDRSGLDLTDHGVPDADTATAYPHIGLDVARAVAAGEADRGLLICGTGIGMAITANKVPGIRATVAHDSYSVERSVLSNNCQVLTLGARVIGPEVAFRLVDEWLTYEFDETSSSAEKVAVIDAWEVTGKRDWYEIRMNTPRLCCGRPRRCGRYRFAVSFVGMTIRLRST